jgi:hypothetical protein
MDTPDIRTIPVSIERYMAELPKLIRNQLEQISNPQILDNDQQELMGLHLQVEPSPSSSYDHSHQKGNAEQEICQAQTQATSLHVLLVWYVIANHGVQRA